MSRRSFLVQSGALACGVAFALSACSERSNDSVGSRPAKVAANSWVTLYTDGSVEIVCPAIELGQGTLSTLPRYVAEELDADWSQVRVVQAPADEAKYGNPMFWGMQVTAGSRTCMGYFDVMRTAGAQARHVLLMTAARKWQVPLEELTTQNSVVTHAASGRRASYAELAAAAEIPAEFPPFVAPDGKPQEPDDIFGEAPPPAAPNAAGPAPIKLKSQRQFKLLGVDAPRIDIPAKVNGSAQFGIDIQQPGMVYALVETGPVQGSAPDRVDDTAVRSVAGVIDVVRLPYGVAIVASDMFAAQQGRERLKVTWQSGTPAAAYDSDVVLEDFSRIARDSKRHPGVRAFELGDPRVAIGTLTPSRTVTFEARSELVYHAPLEPQNAVVRVAADGKSAEAWVSTQWPKIEQDFAAQVLGTTPDKIQIHTPLVGGSFGRRQEPGAIVDATYIAQRTGRTVKVIWTREDDLKRNPHRQALVCRIEAAVDGDGRILAMRSRIVGDSWFARMFPDFFEQYNRTDPSNWAGARHLYDIPLQLIDCVTERRGLDVCYLRGVGCTQTKFALESLIDEVAVRHGKDPLQYRIGMLKTSPRAVKVIEMVGEMAEWPREREGRALGLAYVGYGNSHTALIAEVSVNRGDGQIRVHNVWCTVDAGFAVQPAIVASQMEGGILQGLSMALFEKVSVRKGVMQERNFNDYKILRMSEAPEVFVQVLSTDNAVTGVAEIGVMPVAPAIGNAVARLIGKRLDSMPMLAANVLKALGKTRTAVANPTDDELAPPAGVEPTTYRLGGGRSIH